MKYLVICFIAVIGLTACDRSKSGQPNVNSDTTITSSPSTNPADAKEPTGGSYTRNSPATNVDGTVRK